MRYFQTINELHEAQGYPLPENPLFGLKQLKKSSNPLNAAEVSFNFYFICFKKLKSGSIYYGKTKYDHDSGFMYFMKPRQIIALHNVQLKGKGFSIEIHEDYLTGHPLFTEIQKYDFFDYEISEALMLHPERKNSCGHCLIK